MVYVRSELQENSKRIDIARLMGDSHWWDNICLKHLLDIVMAI